MKKIANGKVRDLYEVDEKSLMMVVSDRISAYDKVMPVKIQDKGIILNQLSLFWFDYVSDIVANHIISIDPNEFPKDFQTKEFFGRSVLVKRLKMLPIECIVRGYMSGSAWRDYLSTGKVCGIDMPKNLKECEKLDQPLFTPAWKALEGEHDENISYEKVVELIGRDLAERIKSLSIRIYKRCAEYALDRGIILADTKFEFGLDDQGELTLADEILTPDSSRFWSKEHYEIGRQQESYDKQYLRNWLKVNDFVNHAPKILPQEVLDKTKEKYVTCFEKITQKSFNPHM